MKNEVIRLIAAEPSKAADDSILSTPVINAMAKGPLGKNKPFANAAIAFVGTHARGTLLSVAKAASAMGCGAENMFFAVKPYGYPEKQKVCDELRARDSIVEPLADMEAPLRAFMERQITEGRQIIICDDGGYGSSFCARFPQIGRHVVGTVEQTTRGVWTLERLQSETGYVPDHPVLALPSSELKKRFECGTVGSVVMEALASHRGAPSRDTVLAVLGGAGTIGSAVAEAAMQQGARVKAFDQTPRHRYWHLMEHGRIEVVDTKFEALVGADVIIGATGAEVLGVRDLKHLKDGVVLASASSGTYEWPLALLDQLASVIEPYHSVGFVVANGTTYTMPWGRTITVLDGGQPINLGVAAGRERSCFDLIMALILAGLAELSAGHYRGRKGMLDVFDDIAARYSLPDLFMVLHQEAA